MCRLGIRLSKRGAAKLVVVMAIVTAALLAAILVPVVYRSYEHQMEQRDDDYIAAAERLADYSDFSDGELMVFDAIGKRFVKASELENIDPYAMSKKHAEEYVVVTEKDGRKSCEWMSANQIRNVVGDQTK